MPSFRVAAPGQPAKIHSLHKMLTTVGRGAENDLVLDDPEVGDCHAHVHLDGRDYQLTAIGRERDLMVNGRRKKKHRLMPDDVVQLGSTELTFVAADAPAFDPAATRRMQTEAYRKLFEFSERLLVNYELSPLLSALIDSLIEVCNAERGFLLLLEGEELRVKVARNRAHEDLADASALVSDSIVEKVVKTRAAVIVSDALSDVEWKNAMSVMALKLSSVMCVPLAERGRLLGAIYLGNNSVAQLFDASHLELLTIFAAQASLIIRNALLVNELKLDNRLLSEALATTRFGEIVGACPLMQEIYRKVQKVATTDISVLITGETGTGKELIARELHRRSARARGPFVTINCGAIPENLLESELFGHVRGAFTGAVQNRDGKFHAAHGGTLFLDEIGEMPLSLQVKLLRVLQEKVIVRVGENRPEPVDIRVVAATHRDLKEEIGAGRFREDLYYRLNVVNVHLPPLRDRGDDVLVVAKYLLARLTAELGAPERGLSPNAAAALRRYAWPGNIRQLENHLKKAIVLADGALLSAEDLGLAEDVVAAILPLGEAKERFQRDYINQVLALNDGNRTKTARDLGVDPRTIFRHLEKEDGGPDSLD